MCPSIRGVTRWCIDCISPAQAGPVPYWPTYAGRWGKVKYVVWLGWLSDICICYQFNIMTDTKYRGKYILINLWWLLTCFKSRSCAGRNYTQIRPFHHRWYSLSASCMQQFAAVLCRTLWVTSCAHHLPAGSCNTWVPGPASSHMVIKLFLDNSWSNTMWQWGLSSSQQLV